MKTSSLKTKDIKRDWYLIDAKGVRLGKLASKVSTILQGKNKATYSPNIDCGDNVIVINARSIDVHFRRPKRKIYWRHTGYVGGIKKMTLAEMLEKKPVDVIKKAVRGMIPKTKLGKRMLGKLYVYPDEEHRYESQKPKILNVK